MLNHKNAKFAKKLYLIAFFKCTNKNALIIKTNKMIKI